MYFTDLKIHQLRLKMLLYLDILTFIGNLHQESENVISSFCSWHLLLALLSSLSALSACSRHLKVRTIDTSRLQFLCWPLLAVQFIHIGS